MMEPDNIDVRKTVLDVLGDCSQCQTAYQLDDARIVGRTGNLWVLAIRCSCCDAQAFVAAVVGDHDDDDALEYLDDEALSEVVAEFTSSAVTVDDVLDMHEFLDAFDGDFLSLFSRRSR
ncbi:MAG TPA: hypothetical protein VFI42_19175 [Thermomicrobiaceae bacterium]|nr:hypothetical protein [Thermomicrobiaceae bacterium]